MKKAIFFLLCCISLSTLAQTTFINSSFENNSISDWTLKPTGAFATTTTLPINGNYSAVHNLLIASNSSASKPLVVNPNSVDLTWSFQWAIDGFNASAGNYMISYLMSNNPDLTSSTLSGYAVGVNLMIPKDDIIRLYLITNGVPSKIIEGTTAFKLPPGDGGAKQGIKVTRTTAGLWQVFVDTDGGFDNLKSIGTVTDNTHILTNSFFGFRFKNTKTRAGKFRFDDVLVTSSTNPKVSIESSVASVKEGESFTITLKTTKPVLSNATLSVNLSGTAAAKDVSGVPTTITIPAGKSEVSFTGKAVFDNETEKEEVLNISLGLNGSNSVDLGNSTTSITIGDFTRIMHYNLLRYPNCYIPYVSGANCNATEKNGYLKTIINYAQPDVFGVNEMDANEANADNILNNVLNTSGTTHWKRAVYQSPTFTNIANMLYYNSLKFKLVFQDVIIPTDQRETNVYKLMYLDKGINCSDSINLWIIQTHFKAGNGSSEEAERTSAAAAIMLYLSKRGAGNFIVMGDLNVYSSTGSSYKKLTGYTNTACKMWDPLNRPGDWDNNITFTDIHTQSTRTTSARGDGGATGGLDSRFDFILNNTSINSGVLGIKRRANTYKALGNDGQHFNMDINNNNIAVSQSIADALYSNSDHLPIIHDFDFFSCKSPTSQVLPVNPTKYHLTSPKASRIYQTADEVEESNSVVSNITLKPNPSNGNFVIEFTAFGSDMATVSIFNAIGQIEYQTIANVVSGANSINISNLGLSKGVYYLQFTSEGVTSSQKLVIE